MIKSEVIKIPIQTVKNLFCPACFKNRKKLSTLKGYLRNDDLVVCECVYCGLHWNRKHIRHQLEEIEIQINNTKIQSYKGEWNFLKESPTFQNNTLS